MGDVPPLESPRQRVNHPGRKGRRAGMHSENRLPPVMKRLTKTRKERFSNQALHSYAPQAARR